MQLGKSPNCAPAWENLLLEIKQVVGRLKRAKVKLSHRFDGSNLRVLTHTFDSHDENFQEQLRRMLEQFLGDASLSIS